MTRYEIVVGTEDHARALAPHMRREDRDEIWASSRKLPLEALLFSIRGTQQTYAALVDGRVVCMFGVATNTFTSDSGSPWLLGSDELRKHYRAFLRGSRAYFNQIVCEYRILLNYVDARNADAVKWLKWLGFTVEEAQPFGPDRLPFHRFGVNHV